MRIYTLWATAPTNSSPWLVAAADGYTVDEEGFPKGYEDEAVRVVDGNTRRELIIEIPDEAVDELFHVPVISVDGGVK